MISFSRSRASRDHPPMAQLRAAGTAAFSDFCDDHCDRAYRVACAVCGDQADAEAAVHDAFLSAWRASPAASLRDEALAVLRLTVVGGQARERSHAVLRDPVATSRRPYGERLRELTDAERAVISLSLYGRLDVSDIAAVLRLSTAAVKRNMHDGLNRLAPPPIVTVAELPLSDRAGL